MVEAGNRWGESPSLPEGEKADRKRGASPGRESVELCGQDTKGSGRSLRGADMAEVYADDPVWVYQRFFVMNH